MIKFIKNKLNEIVKSNLKGYILLMLIFISGFTLSVFIEKNITEEEIRLYFTDFFNDVNSYGTDGIKTFNASITGYIKVAVFMLLSSLTVIGAPVIIIYTLIQGISLGTVIICLFKTFGIKAFLIVLGAVIPHSVIYVPCYLIYSFFCLKNSFRFLQKKNDIKSAVIGPFIYSVSFVSVISIASLIQGYIEPLFIKLIAKQFV